MDDATKQSLAPAAQSLVDGIGDALKAAHAAFDGTPETAAYLADFHSHCNAKQAAVVEMFTLLDGSTQTVRPYDGDPKTPS